MTIVNSADASSVGLSHAGPVDTVSLVADSTGPTLALRGLRAGTGIALVENASDQSVTIDGSGTLSTLASETIPVGSQGATMVSSSNSASAHRIKSLVAGAGMTLTTDGQTVTLTSSVQSSSLTLQHAGAAGSVSLITGTGLNVRGLQAGTGVVLTANTTNQTVVVDGPTLATETVPVGSQGGTMVSSASSAGAHRLKALVAGTGIQLSSDGTTLTVTNASPATGLNLTHAGAAGSIPLVTGTGLGVRGLKTGTGIALTENPVDQTVTVDGPTLATETVPVGSQGATMVSSGSSAGAHRLKAVVAGTGIQLSSDGTTLTVTNASPATGLSLTHAGGAGSVSLVATSGGTLPLRGLRAGYGVGVAVDPGDQTAVLVRSHRRVVAHLRPVDCTSASGQLSVRWMRQLTPSGWPTEAQPLPVPAWRYAASASASHSGSLQGWLAGVPAEATTMGFDLDVTVVTEAPAGLAATDYAVTLCAVAQGWSTVSYTGALHVPALTTAKPVTARVAFTNGTCVGVDTQSRPNLYDFSSDSAGLAGDPQPIYIQLTGTASQAQDLLLLGWRFGFLPGPSTTST